MFSLRNKKNYHYPQYPSHLELWNSIRLCFLSLEDAALQWVSHFKERICSLRSKFFPRRGEPFEKGGK